MAIVAGVARFLQRMWEEDRKQDGKFRSDKLLLSNIITVKQACLALQSTKGVFLTCLSYTEKFSEGMFIAHCNRGWTNCSTNRCKITVAWIRQVIYGLECHSPSHSVQELSPSENLCPLLPSSPPSSWNPSEFTFSLPVYLRSFSTLWSHLFLGYSCLLLLSGFPFKGVL